MARDDIGSTLSGDYPKAEITSTNGSGAYLYVNHLVGAITSVDVISAGSGYAENDTIAITHSIGTGAVVDAISLSDIDGDGKIIASTLNVSTEGSGYKDDGVLKATNIITAMLVYLDWMDPDTGVETPLKLTNAGQNITVGSDVYQAIGNLGSIETVEEGFDLQAYGLNLILSGIPNEMVDIAFADINFATAYQNRPCKIYLAFLNNDYTIIDTPLTLFAGQMDGCSLEIAEEIRINLGVNSRLTNWEIPRGGRFNSEDQKAWYPLDTGFDLIPQLLNKEIHWGAEVGGVNGVTSSGYGYNTNSTNNNFDNWAEDFEDSTYTPYIDAS